MQDLTNLCENSKILLTKLEELEKKLTSEQNQTKARILLSEIIVMEDDLIKLNCKG